MKRNRAVFSILSSGFRLESPSTKCDSISIFPLTRSVTENMSRFVFLSQRKFKPKAYFTSKKLLKLAQFTPCLF